MSWAAGIGRLPVEQSNDRRLLRLDLRMQAYFDDRLHEVAWTDASPADRIKALRAATRDIDALNFKGQKHTVYVAQQATL